MRILPILLGMGLSLWLASAAVAQDKVQISADTFTVTESSQEAVFTGNVVVVNAGGTVGAGELVVNLDTKVSTFTSKSGGRVTGVFTAQ